MKTLILLRHAKSGWDDPVARDFDRPLNRKGRKAARIVGQAMRDQALTFDRVVASPALRVVETLADVADGYGAPIAPDYDQRVYLASPTMLLDLIHETQDSADTLLIAGHNPGLEQLAMMLTEDDSAGLRDAVAVKYPTGTFAEIRLPVDHWHEVREGIGTLARFIRPRDLDSSLGPDAPGH